MLQIKNEFEAWGHKLASCSPLRNLKYEMQTALFSKKTSTRINKSRLELFLINYDKQSMAERLKRLKYFNKISPKNYRFSADIETVYILVRSEWLL